MVGIPMLVENCCVEVSVFSLKGFECWSGRMAMCHQRVMSRRVREENTHLQFLEGQSGSRHVLAAAPQAAGSAVAPQPGSALWQLYLPLSLSLSTRKLRATQKFFVRGCLDNLLLVGSQQEIFNVLSCVFFLSSDKLVAWPCLLLLMVDWMTLILGLFHQR